MNQPPSDDVRSDLIEPVCYLANLKPNNAWPEDLRALIFHARRLKSLYGFEVVTLGVDDPLPDDLIRKLGGNVEKPSKRRGAARS